MKKIFVVGIVVLAFCLGLSACAEKGGTLKLVNDTDAVVYFKIYFGNKAITINDGENKIMVDFSVKAVSDEDTTYNVFQTTSGGDVGSKPIFKGKLSGGETVTEYFSKPNN